MISKHTIVFYLKFGAKIRNVRSIGYTILKYAMIKTVQCKTQCPIIIINWSSVKHLYFVSNMNPIWVFQSPRKHFFKVLPKFGRMCIFLFDCSYTVQHMKVWFHFSCDYLERVSHFLKI